MVESLIPLLIVILVIGLLIWFVEAVIMEIPRPIKLGIIVLIGIFILVYVARVLKIPGV